MSVTSTDEPRAGSPRGHGSQARAIPTGLAEMVGRRGRRGLNGYPAPLLHVGQPVLQQAADLGPSAIACVMRANGPTGGGGGQPPFSPYAARGSEEPAPVAATDRTAAGSTATRRRLLGQDRLGGCPSPTAANAGRRRLAFLTRATTLASA